MSTEKHQRGRWHAAVLCYPINGRCVVAFPLSNMPHYATSRAQAVDYAVQELEEQEPHEDMIEARRLLADHDRIRVGRVIVIMLSGEIPTVGVDGPETWTGIKALSEGDEL